MRIGNRVGGALLALAGVAGPAAAQGMPGAVVGSGMTISPVGSKNLPGVGSPVGGQVGNGVSPPNMLGVNPATVDPKLLAAPLPTQTATGQSLVARALAGVTSLFAPKPAGTVARPPWVPGISRRNRERAEQRAAFRRD